MDIPSNTEYAKAVPIDLVEVHPSLDVLSFKPAAGLVGGLVKEGAEFSAPAVLALVKGQGRYVLLDGVELWLACQRAKVHALPAVIYLDVDPAWCKRRALQTQKRLPGNPIEMAEQLATVWGATRRKISKAELGRRFGIERSRVSHYLRLLRLADKVQDYLREGKLTMGQAKPLVTFPLPIQEKIAQRAVLHGWSARQIEKAAKTIKTGAVAGGQARQQKTADEIRLERMITEQVGATAVIEEGRLILDFGSNLEVLDGIIERLGISF